MKRTLTLAVLLSIFGIPTLFAQTKTTVFGNLGVENVNISIVNTPYGTSTDAKGHYELPLFDRSETVNLYYSCIGYQDAQDELRPSRSWRLGKQRLLPLCFQPQYRRHRVFGRKNLPFGEPTQDFIDGRPRHRRQ